MLGNALTAFATREKVMLRFKENKSECIGTYDKTHMIRIYR